MIYQPARQCPSPHFNERPDQITVDLLVIHNISLPPECFGGGHIESFFQGSLDCQQHPYFQTIADLRVSSHFLICRKGLVTQFVDCNKRAWHAGQSVWQGRDNCNDYSIGVELEGTDTIPYTEEQYQTLVTLTRWLQQQYPAITSDRIVGHSDIAPGRKTDPGSAFDWKHFHFLLNTLKLNQ